MHLCVKTSLLLALVVLGTAAPQRAAADFMLDFDNAVDGGTISYDGAGGALIGTDILFDAVTGIGTPLNNGATLNIGNGKLNFKTGSNLSEGPALWQFAAGGSFVLTGTATDPNNGNAVVASGTLVTGSWTADPQPIAFGNATVGITISGFGVDTKHEGLLEFFGIPADSLFIFANTSIVSEDISVDATGAFRGTVSEADLINSNMPVPEPSTVVVWGLLMGTAGIAVSWRRLRASA